MTAKCEHTLGREEFQEMKDRLVARSTLQDVCSECDARTPHLWACLQQCCFFIGCGKQVGDHIRQHCQSQNHPVSGCLENLQLWCVACGAKLQEGVEANTKPVIMEKKKMPAKISPKEEQSRSLIVQPDDIDMTQRPKGLCGLSNIGNSCYMNSAVQALSNCLPLTQFFMKCEGFLRPQEAGKPNVAVLYSKLLHDVWHKSRPKYVVPSAFSKAFKTVYSHFRGCGQHDSQEFLRCLMDRLHEELRRPLIQVPVPVDRSCSADQGNHQGTKLLGGNSAAEAMDVEFSDDDQVAIKRRPLLEPDNLSADETGTDDDVSTNTDEGARKKKIVRYHSIITDIFDGKLLSSVQCLTCNRVSNIVETFQDLSLPIPGKDDLAKIHASGSSVVLCSSTDPGWITSVWDWMKSWFVGPQVTLQDCLAAFFASDELKGDNMYSCEKCKKLRNGVKYSRVQILPENSMENRNTTYYITDGTMFHHSLSSNAADVNVSVAPELGCQLINGGVTMKTLYPVNIEIDGLSKFSVFILKDFRHEMYFSSKISSFVSFPTAGLDMKPFLTKDCPSRVASYDLTSVITHFGNVGVGHYVAYARNCINGKWYEFSDSFVTEVSEYSVANAEAYVLFYSKRGTEAQHFRNSMKERVHANEAIDGPLEIRYISREWFVRFESCQEPGQITNWDILCVHGAIHPCNVDKVESLVVGIPLEVWRALLTRFGGGPEVSTLSECQPCKELRERRRRELETFSKFREEFQKETDPDAPANCLSFVWYKRWQAFVKGDEQEPPGPIDNNSIVEVVDGQISRKQDAEYGLISIDTWQYFVSIYGGGPEVRIGSPSPVEEEAVQENQQEEIDQ